MADRNRMDEKKIQRPQRRGGFGGGPGHGLAIPGEKAKNFKGTLKRLVGYLNPMKGRIIAIFIMAIIGTVFQIISPKIMGKATTKLFEGVMMKMQGFSDAKIDFDYILQIIIFLIGLYIFSSVFLYVQQYIMAYVAQRTVYSLRKDVNDKLSKLPLKYFDSKTHGEILSRVTNDVDTISTTLQQSVTQLISAVVTLIGIIIMMLTISPILTLVAFITIPISIIATKNIAKISQKYFKLQQKSLGELNGHVEEMFTGHKIIKAFSHEDDSIKEFEEMNEELHDVGWKAQFISGMIMPLMNFVNNIGYVFVCVIGAILASAGSIAVGDIQAFIMYVRRFSQPIVQTANIVNVLQSTIAAAERVFEVLDEEEESKDPENETIIESPKGEVVMNHVKFGYSEEKVLMNDLDIHVKKGQTVAIVGPTGAGKTTLVNLLMRFYDVWDGDIIIDGVNTKELKRKTLRDVFGMVLQDTWLFKGTIRDNIAYGKENATEEEIVRAAKLAHADHFIRTLTEGYDTVLNEEASNISQGQKQLLTIARAVLKDPPLLILDEATSSVDTRTEVQIQHAMTKLMHGRTNFVIAHRLSTIRDADLILVMNDGDIIEKGTHESLLESDGFYAELYYSQFDDQETA